MGADVVATTSRNGRRDAGAVIQTSGGGAAGVRQVLGEKLEEGGLAEGDDAGPGGGWEVVHTDTGAAAALIPAGAHAGPPRMWSATVQASAFDSRIPSLVAPCG